MERMTSHDSSEGEPRASEGPVPAKGLDRVLGTGRREPAPPGKEGRDDELVESNRERERLSKHAAIVANPILLTTGSQRARLPAGSQESSLPERREKEEFQMIRRLPDVRRGPFLLESGLSKVIDEVFRDFDRVGFDVAPSFGRTDVYEKEKHLVFETEIPGVKKDEISIKAEDDRLTISGEVKRNDDVDRENYFRIGRRYGRFQRCFPLPADLVDKAGMKARFEDGVLVVSAPMKESIKEKEKPVEIAVE